MIEYIKRLSKKINIEKKTQITPSLSGNRFSQNFYNRPHHQWIAQNKSVKRVFDTLLEYIGLNPEIDHKLGKNKNIIFQTASGKLACSINQEHSSNMIIVFPDLIEMMYSASPLRASAILAHELGHIFYNHGDKNCTLTTLEKQLEADYFATFLGFGKELQDVLMDNGFDIDSRVRITHITAQVITEQQ